tara:strand:- start:6218 stop:6409 length:192 start_codon:yes stop_codon:yes gene_type:complete
MKEYHNKGFGKAFFVVVFLLVPLPFIASYLTWGNSWLEIYLEMSFPDRCRYEDNKHNIIDNCE